MSTIVYVNNKLGHGPVTKKMEIQDFISGALEPDSYDYSGAVERADEHARAVGEALGRLCQVLHGRGLITDDDLLEIAPGYFRDEIRFEKED